jgi:hypothetical protein
MKRIFINKSTTFILFAIGAIWVVVSCSSGTDKLSLATHNSRMALVDKTVLEPERAAGVNNLAFVYLSYRFSINRYYEVSQSATPSYNYNVKEEWQKLFDEFTEFAKLIL